MEVEASKILRNIPESFAPLARYGRFKQRLFLLEKIISAVEEELSRRKLNTSQDFPFSKPISSKLKKLPKRNLNVLSSRISKNKKTPKLFFCVRKE